MAFGGIESVDGISFRDFPSFFLCLEDLDVLEVLDLILLKDFSSFETLGALAKGETTGKFSISFPNFGLFSISGFGLNWNCPRCFITTFRLFLCAFLFLARCRILPFCLYHGDFPFFFPSSQFCFSKKNSFPMLVALVLVMFH